MAKLNIAPGEYDTGWQDPATSLARAAELIGDAKRRGADLVALPEMCTTGFTMDASRYTEALVGGSMTRLSALARENGVWLVAGLATREEERFYNSSVLIDRNGELVAEYRKQRLFAYAEEHDTYTPGSRAVVAQVEGVRLALFICFDLRFPELFREVAPSVDAIVIVANWPSSRRHHWDTLLCARAIESQAYVVGVNRIGNGGGLDYNGGSALFGPWGELIVDTRRGAPAIGLIDTEAVTSARTKFPFVEDRRA